ncbi:hypothetical protein LCGC14_0971420 [marine sediment metagenome]|uniref:Uncharacterized protein n=1 Tax=marine sediment metagenome TaxID=412755 RepID=A0A0F9NBL2_9ZZZZ
MTKEWNKVEDAIEEALTKLFDGVAAILQLGTIFDKLPDDDRTLMIERLLEKSEEQDVSSISDLLDKGGEPLQELMKLMPEIAERRRREK